MLSESITSVLSALSALIVPKRRTMLIEPTSVLLDPNGILKTNNFLLIYSAWASQPPLGLQPADILNQFKVVCIMHNKIPKSPEHEYLIAETKDLEGVTRLFILERTIGKGEVTDSPDPIITTDPVSAKLFQRFKEFLDALWAALAGPAPSHLSLMEEGSLPPSPSSPSPSFASGLPDIIDTATLSATQSAECVSDSLDKGDHHPANDRFLGQNFVYDKRFAAQNVQYFLPNRLTLFELALLAHVVHQTHPTYSPLGDQCYLFAALVYQAAKKYFGTSPLLNNKDEWVYEIDSHLPRDVKCGRWNGLMVNKVNPKDVSDVVHKYKKSYTQFIGEVILCSFELLSITTFYTD
jgi:hypothetical protein